MLKQASFDGWVYAALCSWADRNGQVQVIKSGERMTLRTQGEDIGTVLAIADSVVRFVDEFHLWWLEDGYTASQPGDGSVRITGPDRSERVIHRGELLKIPVTTKKEGEA